MSKSNSTVRHIDSTNPEKTSSGKPVVANWRGDRRRDKHREMQFDPGRNRHRMDRSRSMQSREVKARTNRSQAYFNPWLLQLYDFTLYRFISPVMWGCSKSVLIKRYNRHCGEQHLEAGVGTGYLLANCQAPIKQLALLDLSRACLNKAAKRLEKLQPSVWRRNLLKPVEDTDIGFQSISINYVMHCVPGSFAEKGIAFGHLKHLLSEGGVLFGASVLKTEHSSWPAKAFMAVLNTMGVFNNSRDTIEELEDALRRNFKYVQIERRRAAALFIATDSEASFNIHRRQESEC